jgi:hypothetical protein
MAAALALVNSAHDKGLLGSNSDPSPLQKKHYQVLTPASAPESGNSRNALSCSCPLMFECRSHRRVCRSDGVRTVWIEQVPFIRLSMEEYTLLLFMSSVLQALSYTYTAHLTDLVVHSRIAQHILPRVCTQTPCCLPYWVFLLSIEERKDSPVTHSLSVSTRSNDIIPSLCSFNQSESCIAMIDPDPQRPTRRWHRGL